MSHSTAMGVSSGSVAMTVFHLLRNPEQGNHADQFGDGIVVKIFAEFGEILIGCRDGTDTGMVGQTKGRARRW